MKKISIIVPCYNEEETLPIFYKEICKVIKRMSYIDFEIILIDDGSEDNTLNIIKEIGSKDKRIKYIIFSRNFGKESAMYAGLKKSSGDYITIIDADLQDPPEMIEEMYNYVKNEGYDCVATRRKNRNGEPILRSFFANGFYYLINKISKTKIVSGARDFRLMSRKMVDGILKVSEYNRFSKGIFEWVGFKTKWLEYKNIERVAGRTKWSFWKLLIYSIEGMVAFSTVPLAISSFLGLLFCFVSLIMIIFIAVRQIIWGGSAYGWSSLVCIILFLSGIQLFTIGILGQYLSRTYLETKKRPLYIVKETDED